MKRLAKPFSLGDRQELETGARVSGRGRGHLGFSLQLPEMKLRFNAPRRLLLQEQPLEGVSLRALGLGF